MIKKIFKFVHIENKDKVKCVVYILRKKTQDVVVMT